MKILTCNTHSLVEEGYEKKLRQFVEVAAKEQFDVIALQEVNQTQTAEPAKESQREGFLAPEEQKIILREDNHILQVASLLREEGIFYHWTWTPIKVGYGKYDEGIGILSRKKPEEVRSFYISQAQQYSDWHSRKVIGVKIEGIWFYSVHLGWWKEETESFSAQWQKLLANLPKDGKIYLMGDFNNPSQQKNEGYDMVLQSGFYDTYLLAGQKDEGNTVVKVIDGWRERDSKEQMRIDFIFANEDTPVKSSRCFFNGENGPVISDHFGVAMEER